MCGGIHYWEVEGLVPKRGGLVAKVLRVWWNTLLGG